MTSINLDMAQFHEIFFEESSEGIESMEKGLLELNSGSTDPEVVNTVFRAAHSIKGAAATFGFNDIAEFTHTLESTLDQVRERKREVTQILIDTLLSSVDYLKYLIGCGKSGEKPDLSKKDSLVKALAEDTEEAEKPDSPRWKIVFQPKQYILKTGNDPFRLIRELKSFCDLDINVDVNSLPDPDKLDPQSCYLKWIFHADSTVKKQDILDVFEWVADDCNLDISLQGERRKFIERRHGPRDQGADQGVTTQGESASIRVNINKIDSLINLVGEMVITQSMLNKYANDNHDDSLIKLRDVVKVFQTNTRDLQEHAMRIRMLPIDFTFQRLPRIVHDISRAQKKKIDLHISGNTTEVDKTVLEKLSDPLNHLLRNAIDHGIENPEKRKELNKPETGTIIINAYQEGGKIIIEISDDGAGLDYGKILHKATEKGIIHNNEDLTEGQIQNLIFQPGFSTATEVTDLSGRGVGMDVVKRNINDLGGSIEVQSVQDEGCKFIIRLPLTLAIIDGQLIRISDQVMIIPILSIIESIQPDKSLIGMLAGKKEVYQLRGDYVPVLRLNEIYNIDTEHKAIDGSILVLVDTGHRKAALLVDEVLGQQQVVIKSIETNYKLIKGISGATVLGDGTVAMIIDVGGLLDFNKES